MTRLTRKQIIDDTAAAYTSRNRAVTSNGACLYKTPSGCMCAIGRYCIDPSEDWKGGWGNVSTQDPIQWTLTPISVKHYDELLRSEVRGHPSEFWRDLQSLHDVREYWNADGLSDSGKQRVDYLHKKWDEPNEPA